MNADGRGPSGSRQRVLMVAPHPCFEHRGSPINVGLMCQALTEFGYEVHLVTYPFGGKLEMPGLVYHRVPRVPFLRSVGIGYSHAKLPLDGLLLAITVHQLVTKRFVAIHAVEEAAFFAVPLGHLFRTPTITDIDSDLSDQLASDASFGARLLGGLVRPLLRCTLDRSTCALTVCQALSDLVTGLSPDTAVFQIEDIPLPAAYRMPRAERAQRLRRELGINGERIVLYTGNLETYQGVELLVDALPAVARRFPEIAVVIVGGDDEQVRRLREYARKAGIGGLLHLTGKRPQEEMPEFMAVADVLVSPRCQGTNTPLKIYTYMLSGRPIIATDLPTHTQVLDSSTAILTAPTPESFAEGVIAALADPVGAAQRAGRARQKVQSEYSFGHFKRKLREVYEYAANRASYRTCRPK